MVYWSRSRQEVWRKGDTSGDHQLVREAFYDCDGDVLLFTVEQQGNGACHTGEYSCFFRRFGSRRAVRIRPSRDEFRALAGDYTVVPVWTELLADLETPVAAYAKLVGDAPGFLLESVEHGERWSRFSFVGRDPVATLLLRDGRVEVEGALPVDVPRDRGILAALEHLLGAYRAPVIPELPPLHGGLMGYLGYDVIREVERLPDVPPDDRHLPDAVMSMIGSLAAFDHWRQRVTLIESVPVARRRRPRRRLRRGRRQHRTGGRQPRPPVAVRAGRAAGGRRRAAGGQELDARRAVPAGGRGGQGVHRRRRHLPGRARPALRPAARRRPVRRLPGAAPGQPEPVHVLRAPPRADDRRLVAGADGAAARRHGDLAADRRHPQAGEHRRARPPPRRRADRAPQGAGRARDARRPRPQRRRAGRRLRHGARRRADDVGALQPRDAPHVAGVGPAARRARADRRAAGDVAGRHGQRGARRCGRWRSSTSSSR